MIFAGFPHLGVYPVIAADYPWPHDNFGQAKHASYKAHYKGIPLSIGKEMPVGSLAPPAGGLLFQWCTASQEADGAHIELSNAWGYSLRTRLLTWVKVYPKCDHCSHDWDEHVQPLVMEDLPGACGQCQREDAELADDEPEVKCDAFVPRAARGSGSYSMQGTESLWVGTRGDTPWCELRAVRNSPEILFSPWRKPHSTKPERAYARIDALWPLAIAGQRLELFARRRRPGWAAWGDEAPDCDLVFGAAIGKRWPVPEQLELAPAVEAPRERDLFDTPEAL